MNFEYKFYITIEGKYFYEIDPVTGMVLASTCDDNRMWFLPQQALKLKEMLEAAGFNDVQIHDGQSYINDLKKLFYAGSINQRYLISKHYVFRGELECYAIS